MDLEFMVKSHNRYVGPCLSDLLWITSWGAGRIVCLQMKPVYFVQSLAEESDPSFPATDPNEPGGVCVWCCLIFYWC